MQPEIIALGEPMLEFSALEAGSLSEVESFSVGWGGDTSNFAVAACRLGGRVGYLTRLGDDEFGDSFVNLWQSEGIDTSGVERDSEAPTGIYFISRKGDRHFFTYYRAGSAASRMTPVFLPTGRIRAAKLLHVSGISQAISLTACDTVFAAIATAREAGVQISYDPNLRTKLWPLDRARAIIHQTIGLSDLVLPSIEDARALTGLSGAEEIARYYLAMGPRLVVVKLGRDGALLAAAREGKEPQIIKTPAFSVQTRDAAGAGDTFDGAFVVAWLANRPLSECLVFAAAAGALTTTGLGAVRPIPKLAQVEALLDQHNE